VNTQPQTVVQAMDVTGQRTARLAVSPQSLIGAVIAQAIGLMELPTQSATQEPILYHGFEEGAGELLPPETSVEEVIRQYRVEAELRVRIVPELEAA
jgi:hypothetical protein